MSLVRRNRTCLVPKMAGEAQGTVWNKFLRPRTELKIAKIMKIPKIQEFPHRAPVGALWGPVRRGGAQGSWLRGHQGERKHWSLQGVASSHAKRIWVSASPPNYLQLLVVLLGLLLVLLVFLDFLGFSRISMISRLFRCIHRILLPQGTP